MAKVIQRKVTILYYDITSLQLKHAIETFPQKDGGRVVIDEEFKKGKSIIAVCDGEVTVLNKIGDRIDDER
ncbi:MULTISPECIES: TIGR02922 family protein [unclassified Thalassotalea]|uniref:TIGR02922 family protein n=1 Tax=unclassified Thalassotalea TaxID=2614972 RepID=UPI0010802354|nr:MULTISPECIES: TIGR02922 family protein [unclassified Thalassotalea]NMP15584.1 TIGR02922 family protein [Thalassotalea sp. Y01]QBY05772.1 TIGR02922 family protein [Thalassotalea sp. HSM 43]